MDKPKDVHEGLEGNVYDDTLHPVLYELGKLIAAPLEFVNLYARDRLVKVEKLLAEKLQKDKMNELVHPSLNLAVPILKVLMLSADHDINDEMLSKLLASSMQHFSPHPAYIQILKQLSSMEAQLLIWDVVFQANVWKAEFDHNELVEMEPTSIGSVHPNSAVSLDNLQRLGLIIIDYRLCKHEEAREKAMFKKVFDNYWERVRLFSGGRKFRLYTGRVKLTRFGDEFLTSCFSWNDWYGS